MISWEDVLKVIGLIITTWGIVNVSVRAHRSDVDRKFENLNRRLDMDRDTLSNELKKGLEKLDEKIDQQIQQLTSVRIKVAELDVQLKLGRAHVEH